LRSTVVTALRSLLGLTLHRPWPVLIARGIKKIENRSWSPEPRLRPGDWIAIHGGKQVDLRCQPLALERGVSIDIFFDNPSNTEGAIVAVAQYEGFITKSDDPWFFGPYGWLLPKVVEIPPVKIKGALGLWDIPAPVLDRVREAYREAYRMVTG
jgi:hypothetical protein